MDCTAERSQTVAHKSSQAIVAIAPPGLRVSQVLHDPTVDKAARKARAKALKQLGVIFRNCKPQRPSAEAVSHKDRLQNVRRNTRLSS